MPKISFVVLYALLVSACHSLEDLTGSNPIIDSAGVELAQYNSDLAQCEVYADEVAVMQKAGSGAVSGAVLGGVFGAVLGNGGTAKSGAALGGIGGAARGIDEGFSEREIVIKRCLVGRGYRVLN
ncbi:MAG: hypothetical protein WDZ52_03355 [Pseudohongiellaceae bacterium]